MIREVIGESILSEGDKAGLPVTHDYRADEQPGVTVDDLAAILGAFWMLAAYWRTRGPFSSVRSDRSSILPSSVTKR